MTGGVTSEPLNGVRRKKDLNTPAAGLPNGRRDWHSNPLDRAGEEGIEYSNHRPALLAESYVKSTAAAHSLLSDITSSPDLREKPQVSTAGNAGKA